jgi:phosphatidylglycerophosphate synthase
MINKKEMPVFRRIITARADDRLTSIILNRFKLFRYIHPNALTLIGLLLNFLVIYEVVEQGAFALIVILLFFRYLADCLDGGVARMYGKKSRIGGVLDTWSDTIFIYIAVVGVFYAYEIPWGSEVAAFVACLNLYFMSLSGSLVDHAGMKLGGSIFRDCYAFLINNSFLMFLAIAIFLYFPMGK